MTHCCFLLQLFTEYMKPVEEWGPAQREHRTEFITMIRSNESMANRSDHEAEQEEGFFQSKMSVASKLSRAASKESGMNRMRTHTNSFSRLPASDVNALAGSAGSGLAMAGLTMGERPAFDLEDIVQQVVKTDPDLAARYKQNVEREKEALAAKSTPVEDIVEEESERTAETKA